MTDEIVLYKDTSELTGIPPEKLAKIPWDEIDRAIEKAIGKPLGICYIAAVQTINLFL